MSNEIPEDIRMQSSWSRPTKRNQESEHSKHATSIQHGAEGRSQEEELARTPCANGLTPNNSESYFPWSRWIEIERKLESKESSATGDSSKDSTEGSSLGELR